MKNSSNFSTFKIKSIEKDSIEDEDIVLSTINDITDGSKPLEDLEKTYYSRNKELELKINRQLHKIRKTHLERLFVLSFGWLIVIVLFLILDGFTSISFNLSDAVIIAFITLICLHFSGQLRH